MHLLYGLLLFLPTRQAVGHLLGLYRRSASWVAVEFILATSMLYEVGEWLLAIFAAPDVADRYNGQQGDMWDAQKDMALAACGAALAAAIWLIASTSTRGSGESRDRSARAVP
jgi:putative membrane protein